MAVKPGAQATFTITLVTDDTFEPISGAAVTLDRFERAIGTFRPVASGTTGADGRSRFQHQLPREPGEYRYRAAWGGTPQISGDTSPEVPIKVAEA